jgi:hypothetical protein
MLRDQVEVTNEATLCGWSQVVEDMAAQQVAVLQPLL